MSTPPAAETPRTKRSLGTALASSRMRRQLIWTVVLVLVAVGGAGLATASDRRPGDQTRPELTWRAEQIAAPSIDAMSVQLYALESDIAGLSSAGRETLSQLSGLDPPAIERPLIDGDAAARQLETAVLALYDMRDRQLEIVDDTRLSSASRALLETIDAAAVAADPLPGTWQGMANDVRRLTDLLDALVRHDGLVFRATTAGRQERFEEALELLAQAEQPLGEASALRDALAADGDVETLNDLLHRYADYDAALIALYEEVIRAGSQESPEVRLRLAEVARAQAALPANMDALRVIVAEAVGPSVAEGLVEIERARGVVAEAIALVP